MDFIFSKRIKACHSFGNKEARIVMVGLVDAGKTAIVYKLKLNKTTTITTIGFNVDSVSPRKNLTFNVWDVCVQDKTRPIWLYYLQKAEGLIYVVDSSDLSKMEDSQRVFHDILTDLDSDRIPILVLANKQDLPDAIQTSDVAEKLGLHQLRQPWHVQGTCALSGDGLYEGFDVFGKMVKEFQNCKQRP